MTSVLVYLECATLMSYSFGISNKDVSRRVFQQEFLYIYTKRKRICICLRFERCERRRNRTTFFISTKYKM